MTHQVQATAAVAAMRSLTTRDVAMLISSEIRREILLALAGHEMDVSTLARGLELDVRSISHCLVQLRKHGLVRVRQVKRRHLYRLNGCVTTIRDEAAIWVQIEIAGEFLVRFRDVRYGPNATPT